ncbi:hypothetical protein WKW77_04120 [Variovorax ureilyticus]|uniref:Uncharacterized protein n=1 Tax=Variovorax ureilyticus TaxID=1836198 RepID=A0ABU8V9A9_9BURK
MTAGEPMQAERLRRRGRAHVDVEQRMEADMNASIVKRAASCVPVLQVSVNPEGGAHASP